MTSRGHRDEFSTYRFTGAGTWQRMKSPPKSAKRPGSRKMLTLPNRVYLRDIEPCFRRRGFTPGRLTVEGDFGNLRDLVELYRERVFLDEGQNDTESVKIHIEAGAARSWGKRSKRRYWH